MKMLLSLFLSSVLLYACTTDKQHDIGMVSAYVPVYANKQEAKQISMQVAQPIVNGGKIAVLGHYVFQVEQDKGIHIIDYANSISPTKVGFIKNAFCRELTLKGNYIYTNNLADLVVLDISNPATVVVTRRLENAFPDLAIQYPPATNCYFECADPSKGEVIGWTLTTVNNPQCKR